MNEAGGLEAQVKALALAQGFELCGIASAAEPPEDLGHLDEWLNKGYHASMGWMQRQGEKRKDVGKVLEGCKALVCVGLVYNTEKPKSTEAQVPWVSRYAWGDDYHDVMQQKLAALEAGLRDLAPGAQFRRYCDTGPVAEKIWAAQAGLGWQGKHTNLINQDLGSWFFLGEILTTLDLKPDAPVTDLCGTCTRCLDACPTQAFTEAYVLDASKCISYLTIEHKGDIADDLKAGIGYNLYGCDICQDVCPWNRQAALTREPAFEARPGLHAPDPSAIEMMNEADFSIKFKGSAMKRAKLKGLKRNAAIVRSNSGRA